MKIITESQHVQQCTAICSTAYSTQVQSVDRRCIHKGSYVIYGERFCKKHAKDKALQILLQMEVPM